MKAMLTMNSGHKGTLVLFIFVGFLISTAVGNVAGLPEDLGFSHDGNGLEIANGDTFESNDVRVDDGFETDAIGNMDTNNVVWNLYDLDGNGVHPSLNGYYAVNEVDGDRDRGSMESDWMNGNHDVESAQERETDNSRISKQPRNDEKMGAPNNKAKTLHVSATVDVHRHDGKNATPPNPKALKVKLQDISTIIDHFR